MRGWHPYSSPRLIPLQSQTQLHHPQFFSGLPHSADSACCPPCNDEKVPSRPQTEMSSALQLDKLTAAAAAQHAPFSHENSQKSDPVGCLCACRSDGECLQGTCR